MRARERVRVIVRVFVSGCMPVLVRVCAREKATEKIDIVDRINSGHNRSISNPNEETQLILVFGIHIFTNSSMHSHSLYVAQKVSQFYVVDRSSGKVLRQVNFFKSQHATTLTVQSYYRTDF